MNEGPPAARRGAQASRLHRFGPLKSSTFSPTMRYIRWYDAWGRFG